MSIYAYRLENILVDIPDFSVYSSVQGFSFIPGEKEKNKNKKIS